MNKRGLLLACAVLTPMAWASPGLAQELEVIQLQHRSAESLLPVLQPLLERGGVLTGAEDKLFLRATLQNSAVLRKAILELDREPRRLLVSVRQSSHSLNDNGGTAAGVRFETRESGGPPHGSGAQLRTDESEGANAASSISQLQVLEGHGALVAAGSSVPIVSPFLTAPGGSGSTVLQNSTTYRELQSGWYVVPRIVGGRAILEVAQQSQIPQSSAEGTVNTRNLSTTVSAPLGEWINLEGSGDSRETGELRSSASRLETRHDAQALWIKVELQ